MSRWRKYRLRLDTMLGASGCKSRRGGDACVTLMFPPSRGLPLFIFGGAAGDDSCQLGPGRCGFCLPPRPILHYGTVGQDSSCGDVGGDPRVAQAGIGTLPCGPSISQCGRQNTGIKVCAGTRTRTRGSSPSPAPVHRVHSWHTNETQLGVNTMKLSWRLTIRDDDGHGGRGRQPIGGSIPPASIRGRLYHPISAPLKANIVIGRSDGSTSHGVPVFSMLLKELNTANGRNLTLLPPPPLIMAFPLTGGTKHRCSLTCKVALSNFYRWRG